MHQRLTIAKLPQDDWARYLDFKIQEGQYPTLTRQYDGIRYGWGGSISELTRGEFEERRNLNTAPTPLPPMIELSCSNLDPVGACLQFAELPGHIAEESDPIDPTLFKIHLGRVKRSAIFHATATPLSRVAFLRTQLSALEAASWLRSSPTISKAQAAHAPAQVAFFPALQKLLHPPAAPDPTSATVVATAAAPGLILELLYAILEYEAVGHDGLGGYQNLAEDLFPRRADFVQITDVIMFIIECVAKQVTTRRFFTEKPMIRDQRVDTRGYLERFAASITPTSPLFTRFEVVPFGRSGLPQPLFRFQLKSLQERFGLPWTIAVSSAEADRRTLLDDMSTVLAVRDLFIASNFGTLLHAVFYAGSDPYGRIGRRPMSTPNELAGLCLTNESIHEWRHSVSRASAYNPNPPRDYQRLFSRVVEALFVNFGPEAQAAGLYAVTTITTGRRVAPPWLTSTSNESGLLKAAPVSVSAVNATTSGAGFSSTLVVNGFTTPAAAPPASPPVHPDDPRPSTSVAGASHSAIHEAGVGSSSLEVVPVGVTPHGQRNVAVVMPNTDFAPPVAGATMNAYTHYASEAWDPATVDGRLSTSGGGLVSDRFGGYFKFHGEACQVVRRSSLWRWLLGSLIHYPSGHFGPHRPLSSCATPFTFLGPEWSPTAINGVRYGHFMVPASVMTVSDTDPLIQDLGERAKRLISGGRPLGVRLSGGSLFALAPLNVDVTMLNEHPSWLDVWSLALPTPNDGVRINTASPMYEFASHLNGDNLLVYCIHESLRAFRQRLAGAIQFGQDPPVRTVSRLEHFVPPHLIPQASDLVIRKGFFNSRKVAAAFDALPVLQRAHRVSFDTSFKEREPEKRDPLINAPDVYFNVPCRCNAVTLSTKEFGRPEFFRSPFLQDVSAGAFCDHAEELTCSSDGVVVTSAMSYCPALHNALLSRLDQRTYTQPDVLASVVKQLIVATHATFSVDRTNCVPSWASGYVVDSIAATTLWPPLVMAAPLNIMTSPVTDVRLPIYKAIHDAPSPYFAVVAHGAAPRPGCYEVGVRLPSTSLDSFAALLKRFWDGRLIFETIKVERAAEEPDSSFVELEEIVA